MRQQKQLGKLFGAQLKMMFREKQVWFWNLFFPVILMVIFMVIFGGSSDNFKAKIAVVETEATEAAGSFLEQLKAVPILEWKADQPVTMEQGDEWVKSKAVDAVIVLPSDSEDNLLKLVINVENQNNATTQALYSILDQFVQQANLAVAGVQPTYHLEVNSVSSSTKELNTIDFLLTGMIALALAQGGLFGMVDMVEIRRKGLLKRLQMTPVNMSLYGSAGMLVRFILGIVQIVLLTVIGVFGFGAKLNIDIPTLIVAFFIGALAFNALGYLFSSFSKSIEAYMGMANLTSFLMMFLSGIFFPTSGFPDWLVPVSKVLPLTYFVEALRDGMVYGTGFFTSEFWLGIGILVAWGAIAFIVGATIYRNSKIEVR